MIVRWIRRRLVLVVLGVAAALVTLGGVAWAYWNAQAAVPAVAQADSVGSGARPVATASGNTVSLTWPATTTAGGHAVAGYRINRYSSATGGTPVAAAQGSCAATLVTATSCTETNLTAGTWFYAVTPILGNWQGSESPRTTAVSTTDTFVLSLPGGTTLTAGNATRLIVTATIGGTTTDTGYTGPQTLALSGPGIAPNGTPPSYNGGSSSVTFTAGVAMVPMTLFLAESPTLTATAANATGSLPITVAPAAISGFAVSVQATATAGTAQAISATAQDAYGNTATSFTGSKTLTWSGPSAAPNGRAPSYPSNPVVFTGGVASGLAATFYDAQTTSLMVKNKTFTGTSAPFTVAAGTLTSFVLPQPATQTAGTAFTVTITGQDAYTNTATGYTGGTLTFTGPDPAPDGNNPSYPANPVTFTGGVATVPITLVDAESTRLTVTAGSVSVRTAAFTVKPGNPVHLAWTSPSAGAGTLGSPCLFTCTASGMNNRNFAAAVSITDGDGNVESDLGTVQTVTVTASAAPTDVLGRFTAPTAGTSVTLTIPASGVATSSRLTFKAPNGTWTSNTLTGVDGPYSSVTASVNR